MNDPVYQEPSEIEVQVMLAIILTQPELNGAITYAALRAGLAAYDRLSGRIHQ